MTIRIHGGGKLESLSCFPIDRIRRNQFSEVLNPIELNSFRAVNSSLGWLGTNASLLCSFYSILLQQRAPNPTMCDLVYQINALKIQRKRATSVSYVRPNKGISSYLFLSSLTPANKLITNNWLIWRTPLWKLRIWISFSHTLLEFSKIKAPWQVCYIS